MLEKVSYLIKNSKVFCCFIRFLIQKQKSKCGSQIKTIFKFCCFANNIKQSTEELFKLVNFRLFKTKFIERSLGFWLGKFLKRIQICYVLDVFLWKSLLGKLVGGDYSKWIFDFFQASGSNFFFDLWWRKVDVYPCILLTKWNENDVMPLLIYLPDFYLAKEISIFLINHSEICSIFLSFKQLMTK